MTPKFFLTPGPSQLYFTAEDHIKSALKENIGSISHRSSQFQQLCKEAISQTRLLLGVPENFYLVFTSSATEVWERLIQNCVDEKSIHFVNGSFSSKFRDFADQLGKETTTVEAPFGTGFSLEQIEKNYAAEFISVTQNETSSGVCFPLEDIASLRKSNPEAIIAVDAVSSIPFPQFDFSIIDSLYFSVQKGMGLPAGLGVWIFNEKCKAKAEALLQKGKSIGTFHTIPSLLKNMEKYQTPATPNVFGIYLLGKVAANMNQKGIDTIRTETQVKSSALYQAIENHPLLSAFVSEKKHRSQTVIVADVQQSSNEKMISFLLEKGGMLVGKGYGDFKSTQIRIANFPAISKELVWQLIDLLESYK